MKLKNCRIILCNELFRKALLRNVYFSEKVELNEVYNARTADFLKTGEFPIVPVIVENNSSSTNIKTNPVENEAVSCQDWCQHSSKPMHEKETTNKKNDKSEVFGKFVAAQLKNQITQTGIFQSSSIVTVSEENDSPFTLAKAGPFENETVGNSRLVVEKETSDKVNEDCETFGKFVAAKLKKLQNVSACQKAILNLITEFELTEKI